MAISAQSTNYLASTKSHLAHRDVSSTSDTRTFTTQRIRHGVSTAANATPALLCIYCGGLYSASISFNAKQNSRSFVCIHCTSRIEAEVEKANCFPENSHSENCAVQRSLCCARDEDREYYHSTLLEIKESLKKLAHTLSGDNTNCQSQIELLATEIEKLKQRFFQHEGDPAPSQLSPSILRHKSSKQTENIFPCRNPPTPSNKS